MAWEVQDGKTDLGVLEVFCVSNFGMRLSELRKDTHYAALTSALTELYSQPKVYEDRFKDLERYMIGKMFDDLCMFSKDAEYAPCVLSGILLALTINAGSSNVYETHREIVRHSYPDVDFFAAMNRSLRMAYRNGNQIDQAIIVAGLHHYQAPVTTRNSCSESLISNALDWILKYHEAYEIARDKPHIANFSVIAEKSELPEGEMP